MLRRHIPWLRGERGSLVDNGGSRVQARKDRSGSGGNSSSVVVEVVANAHGLVSRSRGKSKAVTVKPSWVSCLRGPGM